MNFKKFALIAALLLTFISLLQSSALADMSIQYEFPEGYTVNNWYSNRVQVQGGASPYTFNITSGALPPGFYIRQDGNYFYLEGIPNQAGYKFRAELLHTLSKLQAVHCLQDFISGKTAIIFTLKDTRQKQAHIVLLYEL